jgi:hypothetical protein
MKEMAGTTRLELATSAVTGQRSNQLNYVPTMTYEGALTQRVYQSPRGWTTVPGASERLGEAAIGLLASRCPAGKNAEYETRGEPPITILGSAQDLLCACRGGQVNILADFLALSEVSQFIPHGLIPLINCLLYFVDGFIRGIKHFFRHQKG